MKILSIRGKNLASLYGDFELPLDRGPIGEVGLFSISGPTGSGKSTLVDALCVALYGRTPRLGTRSRGVKIGQPGGEEDLFVDADDERTIISHGTADAQASVDFEGMDGKRYRSEWSVRRSRGNAAGKLQAVKMALHDLSADQPITSKVSEVQEEVAKRIGFNFDEFQRAVVLPQFQFKAFLEAKPDDRAAILERVTGTEIYSRLSMAAHERAAKAQRALDDLELHLGGVKLLSAEEKNALEASQDDHTKRQQAAREDGKRAAETVRWHETAQALSRDVQEAEEALVKATAARNAETPARELLAHVEAVQPLRAVYGEALRSEGARADAEARAANAERGRAATVEVRDAASIEERRAADAAKVAAADLEAAGPELQRARTLDVELAEAVKRSVGSTGALSQARTAAAEAERETRTIERSLQQVELTRAAAENWLRSHESERGLTAEWPRWLAKLKECGQLSRDLSRSQANLADTRKKAKDASRRKGGLDDQVEKLTLEHRTAKDAVTKATAAAAAFDPRALKIAASDADTRRNVLADLARLAAEAAAARVARDEARAEVKAAAGAAQAAKKQQQDLEKEIARAEGAEKSAEQALRLFESALKLEERRSELVDGEPCPLCGAKEHPYSTHAPGKSAIREQKAALEKAHSEMRSLQKQATAIAGELAGAQEREKKSLTEEQKQAHALERSAEKYAKRRDESAITGVPANADEAAAKLEELRTAAEKAASAASQKLDEAIVAQQDLEDARDREHEAREALEQIEDKRREAEREVASLSKDIERFSAEVRTLELRRDGAESDLEPVVAFKQAWREELRADPEGFIDSCEGIVSAHAERETQKAAAEREIAALQNQAHAAAARLAEKRTAAEAQEETAKREAAAVADRRAARADVLGGREADAGERELRETAKNAEGKFEKARTALSAAEVQLAAANQETKSSAKGLLEARDAAAAANVDLENSLRAHSLSRAQLETLLSHDATWIEGQRAWLAEVERGFHEADSRLVDRKRRADEHALVARPEIDVEEAKRLVSEAENTEHEASTALTEVQVELRRDAENRKAYERLAAEMGQQRSRVTRWRSLSDVIGSSDGKKLRVFAQGLALDALLSSANHHLDELARRYQLMRAPGSDLELQLVDRDLGSEVRSVNGLSGGESFLVSLALALGLASLSTKTTHARTLFIDEGFGTLDRDTLEHAAAALESLRASGRTIGVISHVPELNERFGVQVTIERVSATRSRVVLPAGVRAGA